ncbi:LysR substrate-binding domain-containing protein [Lysobacter capsici]|uniref:LysR substrate-binding domain-containing protein n=1 Tax=Lysobacter capsici TaxID=435897 RepID=UPI0017818E98|nr:LysR substrate-binding domain-containing protein [Lysobacter capsici]UOF15575.1 LysR substrate-binding domain-containing protein [Lysobacter capsici]
MFANLPLTALRSFESAARHLSFKAAAEELHVTPTAISHQIKQLEHTLGLALFDRLPRGVALTGDGRRLFRDLHGALLEIAQSLAALQPQRSTGRLTVTTTASFAALWLIPRIGGFYQQHPDIAVRIDTGAQVVDLQQDASVDLAIRYGGAVPAGLHRHGGLREHFGVYGAPGHVEAEAAKPSPTLISVEWGESQLYECTWQTWCDRAGVDWMKPGGVMRAYDEEHYALHAASAGQGLVLASSVVTAGSVERGLLAMHRPDITVPGETYHVLCVPGRERHPPVKAFLRWLDGQMGEG